jgi:surface antigen
MISRSKLILLTTLLSLILPVAPSAYADPPPWAPAHGWRKKHDPYYTGYSGKRWGKDYGVVDGECNWQAVGTVVGGVIGGAVGASVSKHENRTIAVILGSVIGAVIGNQVGKSIDNNDRGCIGHALELGEDHRPVHWQNPQTGIEYRVTPLAGFTNNGRKCREYTLDVLNDGEDNFSHGKACLVSDGTWKAIN